MKKNIDIPPVLVLNHTVNVFMSEGVQFIISHELWVFA